MTLFKPRGHIPKRRLHKMIEREEEEEGESMNIRLFFDKNKKLQSLYN